MRKPHMSTIFNKILPNGSLECSKCFTMNRKHFADLVKALREAQGFTLAEVETNSGGMITDGYISKIENGHEPNITLEKLFALAKGLQVSPDLLYNAAKGEMPADNPKIEIALAVLREMSQTELSAAIKMLRAFHGTLSLR